MVHVQYIIYAKTAPGSAAHSWSRRKSQQTLIKVSYHFCGRKTACTLLIPQWVGCQWCASGRRPCDRHDKQESLVALPNPNVELFIRPRHGRLHPPESCNPQQQLALLNPRWKFCWSNVHAAMSCGPKRSIGAEDILMHTKSTLIFVRNVISDLEQPLRLNRVERELFP